MTKKDYILASHEQITDAWKALKQFYDDGDRKKLKEALCAMKEKHGDEVGNLLLYVVGKTNKLAEMDREVV